MRVRGPALVGFFIAPLVPAITGAAFTRVSGTPDWGTFVGLLPIFYFFAALATLVFGVPAFLLFSRLNLIRWWSALGAGVVGGAIVSLVLRLPNSPQEHDFVLLVAEGAV